MYLGEILTAGEKESYCLEYFSKNNIKTRDELRQAYKSIPISNVSLAFAEEILATKNKASKLRNREQGEINKFDTNTIVVLNDIHIPYHDEKVLDLVFKCIVDIQPNTLILNGDILDFYGLSKFQKRPDRPHMLKDEIHIFYNLFKKLKYGIPNTSIHYILGNHENRLYKVLLDNPGLFDLDELTPTKVLKLDKLGIICHETKYKINDFIFYHGDIVRKDAGYSAKAEFEEHKMKNGISAHTHRLGRYHKTYDGEVTSWYENGCLCLLNPEYFKDPTKANWQHGFSVINMVNDICQVDQILIQNHQFLYNNKLYK